VIIIVAHRLLSICDADNIIVLNQGEVESSGNHLELLKKSKWYSNAWKVQSN
jgi:ATP-binding cassette subfamily B protein